MSLPTPLWTPVTSYLPGPMRPFWIWHADYEKPILYANGLDDPQLFFRSFKPDHYWFHADQAPYCVPPAPDGIDAEAEKSWRDRELLPHTEAKDYWIGGYKDRATQDKAEIERLKKENAELISRLTAC